VPNIRACQAYLPQQLAGEGKLADGQVQRRYTTEPQYSGNVVCGECRCFNPANRQADLLRTDNSGVEQPRNANDQGRVTRRLAIRQERFPSRDSGRRGRI